MDFKDFDETLEMLLDQRASIKNASEDSFLYNMGKQQKLQEIEREIEAFLVSMDDE